MSASKQEIIEVNRRLIGQRVFVTKGGWYGNVTEVKDEETFLVFDGQEVIETSIHDIRSVENT